MCFNKIILGKISNDQRRASGRCTVKFKIFQGETPEIEFKGGQSPEKAQK